VVVLEIDCGFTFDDVIYITANVEGKMLHVFDEMFLVESSFVVSASERHQVSVYAHSVPQAARGLFLVTRCCGLFF